MAIRFWKLKIRNKNVFEKSELICKSLIWSSLGSGKMNLDIPRWLYQLIPPTSVIVQNVASCPVQSIASMMQRTSLLCSVFTLCPYVPYPALPFTAPLLTTLYHTVLHCTTLQYTSLHCTTLHHTKLYCITLHHPAPHCTTLHHTAPPCTTLHHTAPHCTTLHHTAPYCTILHHTAPHCTTSHYTTLQYRTRCGPVSLLPHSIDHRMQVENPRGMYQIKRAATSPRTQLSPTAHLAFPLPCLKPFLCLSAFTPTPPSPSSPTFSPSSALPQAFPLTLPSYLPLYLALPLPRPIPPPLSTSPPLPSVGETG